MFHARELKMIEFKGTYHQFSKTDSVVVLVQYDGILLHVWHLSDPFHRLLSSDEFQVCKMNLAANHYTVRLPNGGYIKTDNRNAFEQLYRSRHQAPETAASWPPRNLVLVVIGLLSIGIGLWWLANGDFLF